MISYILRNEKLFCGKLLYNERLRKVYPEHDRILDIIYEVDSSGLPAGDVVQFMSDKGNPELAQYLRNILEGSARPSPGVPADVAKEYGEDAIIDAMPHRDSLGRQERLSEYGNRIKLLARKNYDAQRARSKLDELHEFLKK